MEFSSLLPLWAGGIAIVLWNLEFFKLVKSPQLISPTNSKAKSSSFLLRVSIAIISSLAIALISFSMTRPRKALKYSPSSIEVNDIYLVVDVSRSMLATDLPPNRLEVAKDQLRKFAALRPTDRLGVIIFSEKVFTLLPLTTDPKLIDQILADIQIGFLGSGTNIGDALSLAVARGQASSTKNKVIVLLTDGVNNIGNVPPLEAAKIAKKFNIKVYTIGLGASMDAKIPTGGVNSGMQRIPGGSIDVKTLKEIAGLTGGKMYLAGSEGSLQEILDEIQELEKTKIKANNQIIYDELFFKYLLAGVLLLVLGDLARRKVLGEVV